MAGLLKQFTNGLVYVNTCKYCSYCKNLQETVKFSNGRQLKLLAPQKIASGGDGVAEASIDGTVVFASAVAKMKPSTTLSVTYTSYPGKTNLHYKKLSYATQLITSRTIDRSIRPLFPNGLEAEIQVVCTLKSTDEEHHPDVIGINAASACLAASAVPWNGPVAAVRMGHVNGKLVTFPDQSELKQSDLNLIVVSGQKNGVVMLEGSGSPVQKAVLRKAISMGVKECQPIIAAINNLAKKVRVPKKQMRMATKVSDEVMVALRSLADARLRDVLTTYTHDKHSRDNEIQCIQDDVVQKLLDRFKSTQDNKFYIAFKNLESEIFRELVFSGEPRVDGRKLKELRPIYCYTDLYKPLHGSARFVRGQTIVECSVHIDPPEQLQNVHPSTGLIDNFKLDYQFPAYSTGEINLKKGTSRREIGHGVLAKKALAPIIPNEMPSSLNLHANVYASNGSSSMGTVCGGTMALLDAGIAIKFPVSGVAVGVITKQAQNGDIEDYKLLTDLMGFEDYFGDMDFKIASAADGSVTALQADIKLNSMPVAVIHEALDRAIVANKQILKIMKKTVDAPNTAKVNLPVTELVSASPGQRMHLLRDSGKHLKIMEIQLDAHLTWNEETDQFKVFAPNQTAMNEILRRIKENMEDGVNEPPLGQICTSIIREIRESGVMVELVPGMKSVFLSNEHLHTKKIRHPSDLNLKVGDNLKVQYFGKDPVSGRRRLSRKSLLVPGSATISRKVLS